MNILLFVNTPAQFHESKYVVRTLQARDHELVTLAQDYLVAKGEMY